ncbi:MAG: hypothetical protein H7174_01465 [Flavobacterium sp.]|nr:hypothetical protein [Flavobacterium sp.]
MKNIFKIIALLLILIILSCKEDAEKPKVSYNKIDKNVTEQKQDTTKIVVAGLPIQFEGTNYLIYPIGNLNTIDIVDSKYDSSRGNATTNFNVANNMENEITGYLLNLKFQKTDSDSLISLTKKPMMIQTVDYLKSVAVRTKQQILVYLIEDSDTNEDNKLDSSDIKSLYLSDISGAKFTKISTDVQEVLDWKLIESRNRIYFRAVEDTNKNGKFDKNDKLHYNYVNLLDKEWKAVEFMQPQEVTSPPNK